MVDGADAFVYGYKVFSEVVVERYDLGWLSSVEVSCHIVEEKVFKSCAGDNFSAASEPPEPAFLRVRNFEQEIFIAVETLDVTQVVSGGLTIVGFFVFHGVVVLTAGMDITDISVVMKEGVSEEE